jgi:hypothetical protein
MISKQASVGKVWRGQVGQLNDSTRPKEIPGGMEGLTLANDLMSNR